jgi:hypothetical protein
VTIPASVEEIGEFCFSRCRFLDVVVFERGSRVRRLTTRAFGDSGLRRIEIPASVEVIEPESFFRCDSLEELVFEKGSRFKKISPSAFGEGRAKRDGRCCGA